MQFPLGEVAFNCMYKKKIAENKYRLDPSGMRSMFNLYFQTVILWK